MQSRKPSIRIFLWIFTLTLLPFASLLSCSQDQGNTALNIQESENLKEEQDNPLPQTQDPPLLPLFEYREYDPPPPNPDRFMVVEGLEYTQETSLYLEFIQDILSGDHSGLEEYFRQGIDPNGSLLEFDPSNQIDTAPGMSFGTMAVMRKPTLEMLLLLHRRGYNILNPVFCSSECTYNYQVIMGAFSDRPEEFQQWLEHISQDISSLISGSFLVSAIESEYQELIDLFLSYDIDMDYPARRFSPLATAWRMQDRDMMKRLIDLGADPGYVSFYPSAGGEVIPYLEFVLDGDLEMLQFLAESGYYPSHFFQRIPENLEMDQDVRDFIQRNWQ